MDILIAPRIHPVRQSENILPAVSIIMPFEPKLWSKNMLNRSLTLAAIKVEQELYKYHSGETAHLLMQKLRSIFRSLNYSTHTISIAICLSPVFEKVLYLNIPVEEKIVVGETFDILDLIDSKKDLRKYIVLVLSDKQCRMYLGNLGNLKKILSNTPESASTYMSRASTTFSELPVNEEITDKFLRYNDNVLDIMLNAYRRPLFVMGNEKIVSQFKNLSKHTSAVVEYVQGNYEEANLEQLQEIVMPYIVNWEKVKEKYLSNQLKAAAEKNRLAFGMANVGREATSHGVQLLIVEKDYAYTSRNRSVGNVISKAVKPYNIFSCIKNPLDEAIEKVLRYGGDVKFVNKDVLKCYDHIALIK